MKPMRTAAIGAAALLATAILAWGASFVAINFVGGAEFGVPCQFPGSDREGSTLESELRFWPPGATCTVRDPAGEVTRVETDQAAWVPGVVVACVATALMLMGAGALRTGRC